MIEAWAASLLFNYIPEIYEKKTWIPGPVDLSSELIYTFYNRGVDMLVSERDLVGFDPDLCEFLQIDFLDTFQSFVPDNSILVSIPPDKKVGEYVRQALSFSELDTVAILTRADFKHDPNVTDLFTEMRGKYLDQHHKYFGYEIVLTSKFKGSKLNYSWFVWDNKMFVSHEANMCWEGKPIRDE